MTKSLEQLLRSLLVTAQRASDLEKLLKNIIESNRAEDFEELPDLLCSLREGLVHFDKDMGNNIVLAGEIAGEGVKAPSSFSEIGDYLTELFYEKSKLHSLSEIRSISEELALKIPLIAHVMKDPFTPLDDLRTRYSKLEEEITFIRPPLKSDWISRTKSELEKFGLLVRIIENPEPFEQNWLETMHMMLEYFGGEISNELSLKKLELRKETKAKKYDKEDHKDPAEYFNKYAEEVGLAPKTGIAKHIIPPTQTDPKTDSNLDQIVEEKTSEDGHLVSSEIEELEDTRKTGQEEIKDENSQSVFPEKHEEIEENSDNEISADEIRQSVEGVSDHLAVVDNKEIEELSSEIEKEIENEETVENIARFNELLVELVCKKQLGLAYSLASAIENEFPESRAIASSVLLRSLALGISLKKSRSPLVESLKDCFKNLYDKTTAESETSHLTNTEKIFMAAAALKPAIISPVTSAWTIFKLLHLKKSDSLYKYCEMAGNYGIKNIPFDLMEIKKWKANAIWETTCKELSDESKEWLLKAKKVRMIHTQAQKIMSSWINHGGMLEKMLSATINNDISKLDEIKKQLLLVKDRSYLKGEIERMDKDLRESHKGPKLTGKALDQLIRKSGEAIAIVEKWISLNENDYSGSKTVRHSASQELANELLKLSDSVLQEINASIDAITDRLELTAYDYLETVVKEIKTLLAPDADYDMSEEAEKYLLGAELLKTDLSLDSNLSPFRESHRNILTSIADQMDNPKDFEQSFNNRLERGDHLAAEEILNYLRFHPEKLGGRTIDELTNLQQYQFQHQNDAITQQIKESIVEVETAMAHGTIDRNEYSTHYGKLSSMLASVGEDRRIDLMSNEMERIEVVLERARADKSHEVSKRLSESGIDKESDDYHRIDEMIVDGDYFTATEYIDRKLRGEQITEYRFDNEVFRDFFPKRAMRIHEATMHKDDSKILKVLFNEKGKGFGINFTNLPYPQRKEALDMLKVWFELKYLKKLDIYKARTILERLGFFPCKNLEIKEGNTFEFICEPIDDRKVCPIPTFGSEARGGYRVICLWERPVEEDIVSIVGDTVTNYPTIVFYFGRLHLKRRRELAKKCHERRKSFLFLDDILLLYLMEKTPRLPAFFRCTLPFTTVEPYRTTSSIVPPEMFYGREEEIDSVLSTDGACFIYGGRQLGKTALLKAAERRFNKPSDGRIALWIDLKAEAIGYRESVEKIWTVIARELASTGAFPKMNPDTISQKQLSDVILDWLNNDLKRKIILLFDEADRFLESDAADQTDAFSRTSIIKNLMDKTERRFKAVFAGLHNVLRTTRLSNNPLAHYGNPICVGPLLNNGEWKQAQALIQEPLGALGYDFEDGKLVVRILSQTNYYPSLIQIYGNKLVKHLNNQNMLNDIDSDQPLMRKITKDLVETIDQDRELRKDIISRFYLTLDLDEKYKLITYLIALSVKEDPYVIDKGLSVLDIQKLVRDWWVKGFRNNDSVETLTVLLDEMVGLGVLRNVDENKYTLRSPNVLPLLGSEEEIVEKILDVSAKEPSPSYDPSVFRIPLKKPNNFRRSPLTVQQESQILMENRKVSIIFGTKASGLEEIPGYFTDAGKKLTVVNANNSEDFAERLETIAKELRKSDEQAIAIATYEVSWGKEWIEKSLETLRTLKEQGSKLRIIFLSDFSKTFSLVSGFEDARFWLSSKNVGSISLQKWREAALKQWIADINLGVDSLEKIREVTNLWPLEIEKFYMCLNKDPAKWEKCLNTIENSQMDPEEARRNLKSFGIYNSESVGLLEIVNKFPDAPPDDVVELAEETIDKEFVRSALLSLELLGIIELSDAGCWQLDSVVARMIKAANNGGNK